MAVLVCSQCGEEVMAHCAHEKCGWLACCNRECDARFYDIGRGILLHNDGKVERLGAAS